MSPNEFSLDIIDVASPCSVPWDAMEGDDRVRFCGECKLNVYNLSQMSRDEAEQLVLSREGRLCVGFFRRADGTVLTRDCPVGLRALRRRVARMATAVAALVGLLTFGGTLARGACANGRGSGSLGSPLVRLAEWIDPPQYWLAGDICLPPPPTTNPIVPAPTGNGNSGSTEISQGRNSGSTPSGAP